MDEGAAAAAAPGQSVEEKMVPHGMVSLYVNVEAGPRGGICFVPTHDNTAVQGSVQVSVQQENRGHGGAGLGAGQCSARE